MPLNHRKRMPRSESPVAGLGLLRSVAWKETILAATLDREAQVVRIGLVARKLRQDPFPPNKRGLLAEALRRAWCVGLEPGSALGVSVLDRRDGTNSPH